MSAVAEAQETLTTSECDRFRQDGWLGPYPMCTPDEMDTIRPDVEAVLASGPPDHKQHGHNRHLDSRLIYELSTRSGVLDRMACLYGPDLLLWRTNFFVKEKSDE